ncbi:MAG: hypothetical protein NC218_03850 [Acetobacter sp.]|nr:hypothetical protein [Acetobacter sp.]
MSEAIIIALVGILPTMTTIVATMLQNRQSRKHSAKQSILQMIMEDQFAWETYRKFPTNLHDIEHEYEVYHANGGNGEITARVAEYKRWREELENQLAKSKYQEKI